MMRATVKGTILWLVVGLMLGEASVGREPLFPGAQYVVGNSPRFTAIGDLNGDGVPDLAVANAGNYPDDGSVSVLLGLGDGAFAGAVDYSASKYPFSVAIADLDGDDVPDLAVANRAAYPEYQGEISVLLGVGDGTFAPAVQYDAGASPCWVGGRRLERRRRG